LFRQVETYIKQG